MGPWRKWIFPTHWVCTLLNEHGDAIVNDMVLDLTSDRTQKFSFLPDMKIVMHMHDLSSKMTDGHITVHAMTSGTEAYEGYCHMGHELQSGGLIPGSCQGFHSGK
eukprot:3112659-Karenia_brevis.AAC.1